MICYYIKIIAANYKMTTVSISLLVPEHRKGVCDWLMKQPPDLVADILELTQTVYNMNKLRVIQTADTLQYTDCIRNWEGKYKRELLKHQEELDDIVSLTRERCLKDNENMVVVLKQRNNELVEQSKRDNDYYTRQIEYIKQAKDDDNKKLMKLLEGANKDRDKMQMDLADLTKLFTGSASNTGVVGENLVHYTFNALQLGMLDDMRYDSSPGCEDFLWTFEDMICSVEVKNSKCLHSKNDIDKHYKRIEEASLVSKVNCGIFLSLNARVPNMSQFEMRTHFGIPVLYVSKHESLSHQTLIELSFRLMSVIWKVGQSQRGEGDGVQRYNSIFADISAAFSVQINNISLMDDAIHGIEKNIQQIFAQVQKLKKNKIEILSSVSGVYDKYPITKPLFSSDESDEQMSDSRRVLIRSILEFNARRRKYPKSIAQVKCYLERPDDVYELAKEFGDEFQGVVEFVKKNKNKIISKF